MEFIADFHVHSKYSRATAKNLDLEHLYIAAQIKGIAVVGTGDFTHPGWFSEIREKLAPAKDGLYALKPEIARQCDEAVPPSCRKPVRFILTAEISNIYKKGVRTRKNHNLIFMPDRKLAEEFNARLDAIGNITSDGRPILGLDAKRLLEILLEVSDEGFLVPAHIWTPWFSLLGSKSGFDSLEECFEDLTDHIFAVETGLSSDPDMNRRVTSLDRLTLISNSDAHSPFFLGREANRFDTNLSYAHIRSAIETGDPKRFLGTFEFYPEEGKYHYDGHRKCNIRLHPEDSRKHGGICPVCHSPLTLGVLYRVLELADRTDISEYTGGHPHRSIIPLTDILSEIFTVGPKTKKVQTNFDKAVQALGPEFDILHTLPVEAIQSAGIPLLDEAISRMRENRIRMAPGFDGEFGKVKIFEPEERNQLLGQKSLFALPTAGKKKKERTGLSKHGKKNPEANVPVTPAPIFQQHPGPPENGPGIMAGLNEDQKAAVMHPGGPQLIVAGPGTGKTRTLTCKIAHLISEENVPPKNILAVTFTIKAAREMEERLNAMLPSGTYRPHIATIHSFCHKVLADFSRYQGFSQPVVVTESDQAQIVAQACRLEKTAAKGRSAMIAMMVRWIADAKQKLLRPSDDLAGIAGNASKTDFFRKVYQRYEDLLSFYGVMDYEDLILNCVALFTKESGALERQKKLTPHLFVDEYQDLNYGQYVLLKTLAEGARTFCVIGDPNQAVYGFRGSDPAYFNRFQQDFPQSAVFTLSRNYRSTETILKSASQVIEHHADSTYATGKVYSGINGNKTLTILTSPSERAEAVAIGKTIENMVGGTGFYAVDFDKLARSGERDRSFSDFAVLYRTRAQSAMLADVFEKAGIPFQVASRKSLFEEPGMAALISYFKLVEGIGRFQDLERVLLLPGSGIGRTGLDRLRGWYFNHRIPLNNAMAHIRRIPVDELKRPLQVKLDKLIAEFYQLRQVLNEKPVEGRIAHLSRIPFVAAALNKSRYLPEAMNQLNSICRRHPDNAAAFVTDVSLQTDTDTYHPEAQKVTLMTLHASKGLEFPVVFIAGCENGLIPFTEYNRGDTDVSEERRLFYVAITRAREQLYLSWSKKRSIYGNSSERVLSPFVRDIENRLLTHEKNRHAKRKPQEDKQLPLFT